MEVRSAAVLFGSKHAEQVLHRRIEPRVQFRLVGIKLVGDAMSGTRPSPSIWRPLAYTTGDRNSQHGVVGEIEEALYRALAEGRFADQRCRVVVLDGPGNDSEALALPPSTRHDQGQIRSEGFALAW